MHAAARTTRRTLGAAIRSMLLGTAVLGVGYTLAITALAQLLPAQANGSMLTGSDGKNVGSALIGQGFAGSDGEALPEYFQPRPSLAGDGYDGGASSGSNMGPENEDLITAIEERQAALAAANGVRADELPADAVTASSSGLDPHISPAYAQAQVSRIAAERGIAPERIGALVEQFTEPRDLGYLGEPRVNVLRINLALDELKE